MGRSYNIEFEPYIQRIFYRKSFQQHTSEFSVITKCFMVTRFFRIEKEIFRFNVGLG